MRKKARISGVDEPASDEPVSGEPFSGATVGTPFGPIEYAVPSTANDRYWAAAGIDHAARRAGILYPPMAANLTIIALQTVAPGPLLHTRQRIECHGVAAGPTTLTVTGEVTDRFAKRDREYLEVTATIRVHGRPLWTSVATFVEAGA